MPTKLKIILSLWRYGCISYPYRLRRLLLLLTNGLHRRYLIPTRSIRQYICHLVLLLGDLILLPEIILSVHGVVKPAIRGLTSDERATIKAIYADHLDLDRILIDDRAKVMTRKHAIAYVSWHMINYWQELSPAILIHECLHLLQYERYGSPYIYEALSAQRSTAGYDYGGIDLLHHDMMMGRSLHDYNLEQQAEIIEDAYRCLVNHGDMPAPYRYHVRQLEYYAQL